MPEIGDIDLTQSSTIVLYVYSSVVSLLKNFDYRLIVCVFAKVGLCVSFGFISLLSSAVNFVGFELLLKGGLSNCWD